MVLIPGRGPHGAQPPATQEVVHLDGGQLGDFHVEVPYESIWYALHPNEDADLLQGLEVGALEAQSRGQVDHHHEDVVASCAHCSGRPLGRSSTVLVSLDGLLGVQGEAMLLEVGAGANPDSTMPAALSNSCCSCFCSSFNRKSPLKTAEALDHLHQLVPLQVVLGDGHDVRALQLGVRHQVVHGSLMPGGHVGIVDAQPSAMATVWDYCRRGLWWPLMSGLLAGSKGPRGARSTILRPLPSERRVSCPPRPQRSPGSPRPPPASCGCPRRRSPCRRLHRRLHEV